MDQKVCSYVLAVSIINQILSSFYQLPTHFFHLQGDFVYDQMTFAVGIVANTSTFFLMYFVLTFALPLIIITYAYAEILRLSRKRIKLVIF